MLCQPPPLLNGQEMDAPGQDWCSGIMSMSSMHETIVVSGSNMGPGQTGTKTLSYEKSAPIMRSKNPGVEEIFYYEPLSEKAKCFVVATCCCWESMLRPRSYFKVTENAVESNLPLLISILPLECCVIDRPTKQFLDKMGEPYPATCCTPYHCCGCIACCGEVVGVAPHPACANIIGQCCFPCLFSFYGGLESAEKAVAAIQAARASNQAAKREGTVSNVMGAT